MRLEDLVNLQRKVVKDFGEPAGEIRLSIWDFDELVDEVKSMVPLEPSATRRIRLNNVVVLPDWTVALGKSRVIHPTSGRARETA